MSRWILVTRGAGELGRLSVALAERGVSVVPFPVLVESAVDDPEGWRRALSVGPRLRWLALTSPRAASVALAAGRRHGASELLTGLPVAAVGARTAETARNLGLRVVIQSRGGGGELAAALAGAAGSDDIVLHACGRDHRKELADGLRAKGIGVVSVIVYRMDAAPVEQLPVLPAGDPEAVLLTSPRATAAYLEVRGGVPFSCSHFAMGETTAAEAAARGVATRPLPQPTIEAFVEELCRIL